MSWKDLKLEEISINDNKYNCIKQSHVSNHFDANMLALKIFGNRKDLRELLKIEKRGSCEFVFNDRKLLVVMTVCNNITISKGPEGQTISEIVLFWSE